MQLTILSPFKKDSYKDIEWVELRTDTGNFIVQEGHAPTILILKEQQPIVFLHNKKEKKVVIQAGIADITRQQVTILIQKEKP